MSNICFKYKNQENPLYYYYIPEDSFIVNEKCLWVEYCEEYDIIKKIQKNEEGYFDFSKNIIDIGSYDGNYPMLLDFNYNYCFEPNKRSSCLLYANMYLKNKAYNTSVYNVALSDVEGTTEFDGFVCESTERQRNFYNNIGTFEGVHTIPTKTLDSYKFENIGFIKIDVEGYEERVIRGGLLTIIYNNYPPILFECWDVDSEWTQEKHDSLFNLIKTLGYEIFEYWGDHEIHLAVHNTKLNKYYD